MIAEGAVGGGMGNMISTQKGLVRTERRKMLAMVLSKLNFGMRQAPKAVRMGLGTVVSSKLATLGVHVHLLRFEFVQFLSDVSLILGS